MSNQSKFFNLNESYRERFYQIPKVFFTNKEYKKLTNDAKIAYAILRDRLNLSIKNNWVDEEENIYFIYSNDKLMEILNCGKEKLSKIKKSLEKTGLLVQKRRGLNKTNILYLLKPNVTEEDIYQIDKQENDLEPSDIKEVRKSNFQKTDNRTSRGSEIERQEVRKPNENDNDLSKTNINDTESNDMNDLNDDIYIKNKHSNHANHSNHFLNEFGDENDKQVLLQEFPEELTKYLLNYSYEELEVIKAIILKAKKAFNSRYSDTHYLLEDIEDELLISLKRFKKALYNKKLKGQNETLQTMQGYLMTIIVSELEELRALEKRRDKVASNIFNF